MKVPHRLKDLKFINIAIDTAREFALERGVALTVERIAVCLGVSRKWIIELINTGDEQLTKREIVVRDILTVALEEVAAENIEYSMQKGSSTLSALMLKNNHGYSDKGKSFEKEYNISGAADKIGVVFYGLDEIKD